MSAIELNPRMDPDVRAVGNERTPVIVIDDPITDTGPLQEAANEDEAFGHYRRVRDEIRGVFEAYAAGRQIAVDTDELGPIRSDHRQFAGVGE